MSDKKEEDWKEEEHEDEGAPTPQEPPESPLPPKPPSPDDYEDDELNELRTEYLEEIESRRDDMNEKIEAKRQKYLEKLERVMEKEKEHYERDMDKIADLEERIAELKSRAAESRDRAKKAQEKAKRINIYVDPEMSDEWREWSEKLGSSVSELVRKSMQFVKENIGDVAKLEKLGEIIEKTVEETGIEDIGNQIEQSLKEAGIDGSINFGRKRGKVVVSDSQKPTSTDERERIKKRITGLVKLHKSIPIDKLAQALNKSEEFAENMIYELAAEGIEGELEEGVFKYSGKIDDVLAILFKLIDRL
jgi:DNA repair exonuclease SbcCD ATPase subunit